jgi:putative addiction module CopG family antidote
MTQVPIPAELESFVQGVVDSGSYHNPTEVVDEALRLLAQREQLLHDVKAGVELLDRGEFTEYGVDSQQDFLADIRTEEESRCDDSDEKD